MSRWFRFYADALRNPKVASLSDREFRLWIRLLAVASENEGVIPPEAELKLVLNTRLDHLLTGVKALLSTGLIDRLEAGYEPHNWRKFQYKSDTSTDRVRKHREERNVSETPPDTETEAETEAETERKSSETNVSAAGASPSVSVDARTNLWRDGTIILRSMTGKSENQCRQLIGKWLKEAKDDCNVLMTAIVQADANRVIDPVAWISASLVARVPSSDWRDDPLYRGVL